MRSFVKFLSIIALIALGFTRTAVASGFCEGWENGYKSGYCYEKVNCLEPLVPLCPLPRLNEDSFKGGYERGFLAGLSAQRRGME